MRFINTIQVNHLRKYGVNLHLNALWGSPVRPQCYRDNWPGAAYMALDPGGDFVPGFRATLHLGSTGSYVVMLTETATQFALWSNQQGVIYQGVARDPQGRPTTDPQYFSGQPIAELMPAASPSPLDRFRAVAAAIAGLISPTLHAEGTQCCVHSSQTGCFLPSCINGRPCEPECSYSCRNVGGQCCTWCCAPSGCDVCVPLGCTSCGG